MAPDYYYKGMSRVLDVYEKGTRKGIRVVREESCMRIRRVPGRYSNGIRRVLDVYWTGT